MPALSHPRLLFPPAITAVVLLLLIAHSATAPTADSRTLTTPRRMPSELARNA
jgi:hypothetical protein